MHGLLGLKATESGAFDVKASPHDAESEQQSFSDFVTAFQKEVRK